MRSRNITIPDSCNECKYVRCDTYDFNLMRCGFDLHINVTDIVTDKIDTNRLHEFCPLNRIFIRDSDDSVIDNVDKCRDEALIKLNPEKSICPLSIGRTLPKVPEGYWSSGTTLIYCIGDTCAAFRKTQSVWSCSAVNGEYRLYESKEK